MNKVILKALAFVFVFLVIATVKANVEVVTVSLDDDELRNVFAGVFSESNMGYTERMILESEISQLDDPFKEKLYSLLVSGSASQRSELQSQMIDYVETLSSGSSPDITSDLLNKVQKNDLDLEEIIDQIYS